MSGRARENVLVIVGRMPVAGQTKTLLGAEIGHEAAAALYAGFVADLATAFRPTPDYDVVWAHTPESAGFPAFLRSVVGADVATIAQSGERFNERLTNIFRWAEGMGYARTAVMASDSPQLQPYAVAPVFRLLETARVVLGRVSDGGYYLVGMRGCRDLLLHVPMSTADAADAVETACREQGLAYAELPPRLRHRRRRRPATAGLRAGRRPGHRAGDVGGPADDRHRRRVIRGRITTRATEVIDRVMHPV